MPFAYDKKNRYDFGMLHQLDFKTDQIKYPHTELEPNWLKQIHTTVEVSLRDKTQK
jgi:hypothetical protein